MSCDLASVPRNLDSCQHPVRDFHEEFKGLVLSMDPYMKPEHTSMWLDSVPATKQGGASQIVQCEAAINQRQAAQNKLAFEADALALARDASMLGSLYQQECKTERASRIAKVLHLKQENALGSTIVSNYMAEQCKHVYSPTKELLPHIDEAQQFLPYKHGIEAI